MQDSGESEAMLAIDPDWVADQARALLEDIPVDAFKIGSLLTLETQHWMQRASVDHANKALNLSDGRLVDYPTLLTTMVETALARGVGLR